MLKALDPSMHALPAHQGVEILRSEVGSTLHGTGLPGGEDLDQMGIFVEFPRTTLGLHGVEQYEWRTAKHREHVHVEKGHSPRSQPGDTDLVVYTLRKWTKLALNGNPSVLLPLFAPENKLEICTPLGEELRDMRSSFWSRRAANAFLGYMQQQRGRITGERAAAGRTRTTTEEAKAGKVDWKYAMHMLRLGYQGVEYLSEGTITLPIPAHIGDRLREIRKGEHSLEDVLTEAELLETQMKQLLDENPMNIPDQPDSETVETFVIRAHLDMWVAVTGFTGSYLTV